MPNLIYTVLVAALTAVVVLTVNSLTVMPRLEARNRRIQAAHRARDAFESNVLIILGSCQRLGGWQVPSDASPKVRQAVLAERERWFRQLDDATMQMVDQVEQFALGYVSYMGIQDLAIRYAGAVRAVMISERAKVEKVELLVRLTEPVHGVFFARWWWRISHLPDEKNKLLRLLDELERPNEG